MIVKPDCLPVFQYVFQPVLAEWRRDAQDGGFRLTLCQDDTLVFEPLYSDGTTRDMQRFPMPAALRTSYYQLIDSGCAWLALLPEVVRMPAGRLVRMRSGIGLSGFPYVWFDDIASASHLPFLDPAGRAARRMTSLLEDIAELFAPFGIQLTVNDIALDYSVLTPLSSNNMDTRWTESVS